MHDLGSYEKLESGVETHSALLILILLFFSLALGLLEGCLGSKGGDSSSGASEDVTADASAGCSNASDDSVLSASRSSWNSSIVLSDGSSIATSREIRLTLSARKDRKIGHYYLSEDSKEPSTDASGWVGL